MQQHIDSRHFVMIWMGGDSFTPDAFLNDLEDKADKGMEFVCPINGYALYRKPREDFIKIEATPDGIRAIKDYMAIAGKDTFIAQPMLIMGAQ